MIPLLCQLSYTAFIFSLEVFLKIAILLYGLGHVLAIVFLKKNSEGLVAVLLLFSGECGRCVPVSERSSGGEIMDAKTFVRDLVRGGRDCLDLISYRNCVVCGSELKIPGSRNFCLACARSLLSERLLSGTDAGAFQDPSWRELYSGRFAGAWSAVHYRKSVRDILVQAKFYQGYEVMPLLCSLFEYRLRQLLRTFSPDLLVPVPLPFFRLLRRGINVPLLLARHAGRRFGIPSARLLKKRPFTRRQVTRSRETRLQLAARSFRITGAFPKQARRVLVVDDVMTTGATGKACVTALFEHGIPHAGVLTFAHG